MTSTGVSVFGRMCRRMMRLGRTPMIRAASTYSLRRSTMVEARTMRAYCTQPVSAIDSTRIAAEKLSRSDWRQQLAEHRAHQDRDQQRRDRQHRVADPHQQVVEPPAEEAGHQPDRDADRHGEHARSAAR